jgi:hypothetical protein
MQKFGLQVKSTIDFSTVATIHIAHQGQILPGILTHHSWHKKPLLFASQFPDPPSLGKAPGRT